MIPVKIHSIIPYSNPQPTDEAKNEIVYWLERNTLLFIIQPYIGLEVDVASFAEGKLSEDVLSFLEDQPSFAIKYITLFREYLYVVLDVKEDDL